MRRLGLLGRHDEMLGCSMFAARRHYSWRGQHIQHLHQPFNVSSLSNGLDKRNLQVQPRLWQPCQVHAPQTAN